MSEPLGYFACKEVWDALEAGLRAGRDPNEFYDVPGWQGMWPPLWLAAEQGCPNNGGRILQMVWLGNCISRHVCSLAAGGTLGLGQKGCLDVYIHGLANWRKPGRTKLGRNN